MWIVFLNVHNLLHFLMYFSYLAVSSTTLDFCSAPVLFTCGLMPEANRLCCGFLAVAQIYKKDSDIKIGKTTNIFRPFKNYQMTNGRCKGYAYDMHVIELTAVHPQGGTNAILKLDLNTYRWDCKDNRGTSITQTQFCDGHEDCPNGRDENENICQVSQLPKKLSYLFYVYMLLFIWVYFTLLRDERPESVGQNIAMVAKQSFKKCLYQREESDFKAIHVENH